MKVIKDISELEIPAYVGHTIKTVYKKTAGVWTIAAGITLGLWGFVITTWMFWFGIVMDAYHAMH